MPTSVVTAGWSNPYRYDGRDGVRYDGETGLYWMSVRAYDPALGRFLQHDPLGRAPFMWVDQPYVYAGNNPIINVDPSGQRYAGLPGGLNDGIQWDFNRYSLYGHPLSMNVHIAKDDQHARFYDNHGDRLIAEARKIIPRQNAHGGPNRPGTQQYPTDGGVVLFANSNMTGTVAYLSSVIIGTSAVHAEQGEIFWAVKQILAYKARYGFYAAFGAEYDVNLLTTKEPCGRCVGQFNARTFLNQLLVAAGDGLSAVVHLKMWVIEPDPDDPNQSQLRLWDGDQGQTSTNPFLAALHMGDE